MEQTNIINELFQNTWGIKIINTIVIIVISVLLYKGLMMIIKKNENRGSSRIIKSQKGKTYMRLIKSIIRYVFIIITTLMILQINGIDVSSMLAGVGVLGVIIGFAVQDALKDIIRGLDIISDSYYQVGDVIKVRDVEGKVLAIGIKTTKIEDVRTFNTISIANRNIEQVEVLSDLINIDIPMPYELKATESEKIIEKILKKIDKLENTTKCEYTGVNELADSAIKYQIKVYCKPIHKVQMKRDVLRCIILGLEENNIQVPYNQIDVHNKI